MRARQEVEKIRDRVSIPGNCYGSEETGRPNDILTEGVAGTACQMQLCCSWPTRDT